MYSFDVTLSRNFTQSENFGRRERESGKKLRLQNVAHNFMLLLASCLLRNQYHSRVFARFKIKKLQCKIDNCFAHVKHANVVPRCEHRHFRERVSAYTNASLLDYCSLVPSFTFRVLLSASTARLITTLYPLTEVLVQTRKRRLRARARAGARRNRRGYRRRY